MRKEETGKCPSEREKNSWKLRIKQWAFVYSSNYYHVWMHNFQLLKIIQMINQFNINMAKIGRAESRFNAIGRGDFSLFSIKCTFNRICWLSNTLMSYHHNVLPIYWPIGIFFLIWHSNPSGKFCETFICYENAYELVFSFCVYEIDFSDWPIRKLFLCWWRWFVGFYNGCGILIRILFVFF